MAILINGSISSGKSTFTKLLSEELNVKAYYEDKFYESGKESRKNVSAMLQVAFLTYRLKQLKQAAIETNSIMDSSLISDHIMAKNLYERGEMTEAAYNVYITLNQQIQEYINALPANGYPDLIIYLDISPKLEIEKIKERNREIETNQLDIEYFTSVNNAYKKWYNGYSQAPIIRIDLDKYNILNNLEDRKLIFDEIKQKMKQLGLL